MNIEQLTGEDIVATELPRKFNGNFANVKQEVESHINNKNNPHKVTAEQLGLASAYIYQGDVETFQNLPTQGVQKGWVYNVKAEFTLDGAQYPAGTDVAWDGTKWNTLGGSLKGYVRKVNNVAPDSNANVNVKNLIATQIVNGQDLNNIKAEGRYQCDTDSVAATLLNSPLKTAFYLDVYVNSSTQVKQVITSSNATPQVYIRTLVNNTWGSWRAVQFTTTVYNMTEIKNTANTPIKLTGSFSHKYKEIAGGNIDLVSNIDVYWVTPTTSDIGVTINLSALTKQSGYSRFITLYVDGSKCPDLRTITYTNKPSGFTLMNEPEKMMGGMVNVIGIEIVGSGNIYTITNNGSSGSNVAIATEEEALEGIDNTKMMTPLRTKQAAEKFAPLKKVNGQGPDDSGNVIIDDLTPVGDVVYRPYLRQGYVKANGATVNRADYPRLVAFANANNLWTTNPANEPWKFGQGNGSTTMVLPNYVGRFIQGGDSAGVIAAGLPNITGYVDLSQSAYLWGGDGAFNFEGNNDNMENTGRAENKHCTKFTFNASKSNSIYGSSATVQPPSVTLIPQLRY